MATFTYNNREIDWIYFNERVLQEAGDTSNPVFERLRFLAIFSSNLDEFFKVRVSKLRQIKKVKKSIRKPLGLRPNKLLKTLLAEINEQQIRFGQVFREGILPELADKGIHILELQDLKTKHLAKLKSYYDTHLKDGPTILNAANVSANAFADGQLYLVADLSEVDDLLFVKVPTNRLGRFVEISRDRDVYEYVFLEDILKAHATDIFPGKAIKGLYSIKISKDAELYLEEDYEGEWIEQVYASLSKRQTGQPTRLLYEGGMPKTLRKRIRKALQLGKVDMVKGGTHHNFSDFFDFPNSTGNHDLEYKDLPPLRQKDFEEADNIFDLIREKDRLLHFPYQRFGYLEKWLLEAANDPQVVSIHISLYRIAKESLLTSALLKALENGKKVVIFVEGKARFDEANNIKWGIHFEEKGAEVFYSFPNVKVHSKILYIQRKEGKRIKGYAYIGTGNFNAKTSKIYCDHALFTAKKKIGKDLEQVFRVLKRELILPKLKTLLISPYNTRQRFEELIQAEITNAKKGLPAKISIKMNSLEDKKMINQLYRASNAGVKIKLLVRGFCCLIPQIPGQSENIEVISVVDRFLEHARVFLFHNNGEDKLYMGSADWMTRNLDKRIEVLVQLTDKDIFRELKEMLELQFSDNTKARMIDGKGTNDFVAPAPNDPKIRSQYHIYESLEKQLPVRDTLKTI
ncbi:polyphosphate kinase 1 [Aggregatimonas sangjinii]|uniref:Polyphosphate kinase n=1 Tax=Aggregatimonas sangjinii TaxID=2583587 RepID=A0A5B7SJA0_9FLAO|nr:polyphosphate kinase 1 [Aggregatimonas sangjinii]QCW98625.1 polyphosphate kinase 1 [Aggregatimonas sangjinii]